MRRFYFAGVLRPLEQAQQEHHAIVRALRSRDEGMLEDILRGHNQAQCPRTRTTCSQAKTASA